MKKIKLKKLELKIDKVSELSTGKIKGGGTTMNRTCLTINFKTQFLPCESDATWHPVGEQGCWC